MIVEAGSNSNGAAPELNDQSISEYIQVSWQEIFWKQNQLQIHWILTKSICISARKSAILPVAFDASFQDGIDTAPKSKKQEIRH